MSSSGEGLQTPGDLDSGPSSSDALLREVARAPDRPLPSTHDPRIGSRFGRFQILERLGCGGMGIVYSARDAKLSRVVAIKLLHADATLDEHRRRRLVREARAASAITHPGIATVFDVGEIDGHVFVAMERVSGGTLRHRLSEGLLPVEEAVRLGTAIARALGAAHRAGIVHRDLKPDNVMIDEEGQIKILDFGLAKPLESAELEGVGSSIDVLTQEGRILGTPSYMSPEQASGEAVDQRSDVFSLGVVLYEMITGARPFVGGTAMKTLVAVSRDRPEAVSKRRPGVPLALSRLVERCLEKDPAARPASGEAIAAELERALQRPPVTGRRIAATAGISVAAAALAWALLSSRAPGAIQPAADPSTTGSPGRLATSGAPEVAPSPEPPPTMGGSEPAARAADEDHAVTRPRPSARSSAPRVSATPPVPSASAAAPAASASARAPRDPLGVQK